MVTCTDSATCCPNSISTTCSASSRPDEMPPATSSVEESRDLLYVVIGRTRTRTHLLTGSRPGGFAGCGQTAPMTRSEIRDSVLRLFESAREAKGSPCEPERILAYLTEPPAPRRRAADTFAGRRRFVRFMDSLQLEFGVCFTRQEWERGMGLDELVDLIQKKRASPKQQERLALQRLGEARRTLNGEPVTFGVVAGLPLALAGLLFAGTGVRVLLVLLWIAIVAGVAAVNASQYRVARELVERTARGSSRPGPEGDGPA